ncbi:membrane protein DedA, SNARE-associated domain [Alteribacillus persepolensis]|uniref:Membrane protein DedA, SNARE-associated domain n=1 Tax=Alteribacillus persepolensis TaxID=568899 RepID=A0A1G8EVU0_9BACI|nr:small multi-drug export protein [Alteribacillus persepolensis]SDH73965.1 membrane protein DedA, SNARE-associated domain [Alteribacillus persepolensis]
MEEIYQWIQGVHIVYQLAAIFVLGFIPFIEAFVAIPIGLVVDLPFVPTVLLGLIGNWLSIVLLLFFSSFITSVISKRKKSNGSFINRRMQKAQQYFNKYGVPGLSLAGPIIGSNHISAIVCLLARSGQRNIIIWQTISILLWGIAMGILILYGVDVYQWLSS